MCSAVVINTTGKETTSLTAGTDSGKGMEIDDQGRIVVGGTAGSDMGVVRHMADGTLDATFDGPSGSGNGKFAIDVSGTDSGEDMKIDTQGRIVISGNTDGATNFGVIRLNEADGTLDSTFGTGGKVVLSFASGTTTEKDKALMVQTDGRIVVAGQSGSNFAVERISGGGTRYYVMQDANWNVTGVADGAGNVVERYQYDPYGKVTVLNANFSTDPDNTQDVNEPFLFQGLKYDANSGNYNARNRDLRSSLGSWIQADPSGYPDGANRYLAVNSNPTGYLDPSGLCGECATQDISAFGATTQPSTIAPMPALAPPFVDEHLNLHWPEGWPSAPSEPVTQAPTPDGWDIFQNWPFTSTAEPNPNELTPQAFHWDPEMRYSSAPTGPSPTPINLPVPKTPLEDDIDKNWNDPAWRKERGFLPNPDPLDFRQPLLEKKPSTITLPKLPKPQIHFGPVTVTFGIPNIQIQPGGGGDHFSISENPRKPSLTFEPDSRTNGPQSKISIEYDGKSGMYWLKYGVDR